MPPLYTPSDDSDTSTSPASKPRSAKRSREDDASSTDSFQEPTRKRNGHDRRASEAKLKDILKSLSDNQLSLYELLAEAKNTEDSSQCKGQWECLVDELGNNDRHNLKSYFDCRADGSRPLDEKPENCPGQCDWEAHAKQIFRDEVQAVGRSHIFGEWVKDNPVDFITTNMPQAISVIGKYAPYMSEILREISLPAESAPLDSKKGSLVSTPYVTSLKNRRVLIFQASFADHGSLQITIFSILCHAQKPQTCTNIPTQMSQYLLANGVRKDVIQTLHTMGVCSPYETFIRPVKDLPVEGSISCSSVVMGDSGPTLSKGGTNGNLVSHSNRESFDGDQFTNPASISKNKPRTTLNDARENSMGMNYSGTLNADETAALNHQLGVPSTTRQPEVTQPYSKRPQWRVTQPNGFHLHMQPTTEPPKSVTEESTALRSALLTSAATNKGYGLLIPPKRSTPNIYHYKASHPIFRVNDQRRKIAPPVPLPPLPPALTNPTLPPNASPQERLQYAMIMHNHSRLNQGKG